MAKIYRYPCPWGCGTTVESTFKVQHGCGAPACVEKHNQAAEAEILAAKQRRAERARERHSNPPRVMYGEWGRAMMLANPDHGRKAARLAREQAERTR